MKKMFMLSTIIVLTMGISLTLGAGVGQALSLTFDLGVDTNSKIVFTGGTVPTFNFSSPTTGFDFHITSGDGLTDLTTIGLEGHMDGTYKIGAITSSPLPGGLTYQTALVTDSGAGPFTIRIVDASSVPFTATVDWGDIYTLGNATNSSGGINSTGTFNLTNITYTGTNTDLLAFKNGFNKIANASFNFTQPGKSLTDLTASGALNTTSWSGTMSATTVPLPASALLLGSGLMGLGLVGWRRKSS